MSPTLSPAFSRIATIDSVYRPVERFLERFDPTLDGPGLLSRLDAYLLHLVAEFCPGRPSSRTWSARRRRARAASSAWPTRAYPAWPWPHRAPSRAPAGRPSGTCWATSSPTRATPPAAGPSRRSIGPNPPGRRSAPPCAPRAAPVPDRRDRAGPRRHPAGRRDPRGVSPGPGPGLRRGQGRRMRGRPAARRRLPRCSPYRLRLLREAAAPLLESRLALVARRDCPFAEPLVRRIEQLFTTNHDFLTLLRDSCMYAVDKGVIVERLDREIEELRSRVERQDWRPRSPGPRRAAPRRGRSPRPADRGAAAADRTRVRPPDPQGAGPPVRPPRACHSAGGTGHCSPPGRAAREDDKMGHAFPAALAGPAA